MTPRELLLHNAFNCDWASSPLLFFSGNVFSPLIYYSHLVPMIAGLLLAFIVWRQRRGELINKLFILLALLFAGWVALDLLLWADANPDHIMFAWTSQIYIEPLVYFVAFYLAYAFVKKKDIPIGYKIGVFALYAPVLFLAPTTHTLSAFDYTNCEREALEGNAWQYVYVIEGLALLALVILCVYSAVKKEFSGARVQNLLFSLGTILFLGAFSFGNIVGSVTENWTIAQNGLFGMPFFLGIVLYLMTRYNSFSISVLSTSVLVWSLWFLLFSILFLQSMDVARPVIIGTLVIFSLIGVLLVRSVRREIEQREKIEVLAGQLEEANSKQVILIHFITHQIKGFIAKSRNIFSMALEGDFGPVDEKLKPILQAGFESDTKGAAVIQEILSAANIKSGKVEYTMTQFDLKTLVEEVVKDLSTLATEKGLTLNSHMPEEPVIISGDRGQLLNVYRNLIDNSIKYTQAGSVDVYLEKNDGEAQFSIKDTGVGITPEDMKNLFTEGGHGKESTKVNVDSTGYGLYIVKQIVDSHKGKVWAESEGAGKGTQFYVDLPSI